jgi:Fe2+ transport system protein FeoA
MNKYKLTEAPNDKSFQISKFNLDIDSRHRLHTMGIHLKDIFTKQSTSSFGPILIQNMSNNSTKIALGRELAEKIVIECD